MKIIKILVFSLGIIFLSVALLSFTTFLIVKHLKIEEFIEQELERELGVSVSIKHFEYSPLLTHLAAKGVSVRNPKGFQEEELCYIPSIDLVFDPLEAILRKRPNIYIFKIEIERFNIIKNSAGKVNINELPAFTKDNSPEKDETPFYFDVLVLSVGEVNYIEHSLSHVKTHRYPIGMKDQAFVGLENEEAVIKLITFKAIQNTDIGKLINLTVVPIVSNVSDTMNAALGTAKSGVKGAWEVATLPFKLIFGK